MEGALRMKLSVVMPVYNEKATLEKVIERVLSVGLDIELLCVDDGSRDGSREILDAARAELRPVPRPRPIFLANSERCAAYLGATIG